MWLAILSDQLPVEALVSRYLTNKLIGREPILDRRSFPPRSMSIEVISGISSCFQLLFQSQGQVAHVLRTRSPVTLAGPLDLHVLSTPPAFVLSQDQTLHKCLNARPPESSRHI